MLTFQNVLVPISLVGGIEKRSKGNKARSDSGDEDQYKKIIGIMEKIMKKKKKKIEGGLNKKKEGEETKTSL